MKKILLIIIIVASVWEVQAQSRKQISSFSLIPQYFNPALTGQEGSVLKSIYRNQWTGFEDAPKTLFISAELDLADLATWKNGNASNQDRSNQFLGVKNAIGLSLLRDTFGPYRQTQLFLNYSSRVQLSEKLSLRAGAAVTYDATSLDQTKLVIDITNDPKYQNLFANDNTRVTKVDINVGVMLMAEDYYIGYALQDAAKGKLGSGGTYLENAFPTNHVVQAGYRKVISDQFGLIVNGLYRYDSKLRETFEGQLKGVINNSFWAGVGYRQDLAYSFTGGMRFNQIKVGYTYETTTGKASRINGGSNEIVLIYNLMPVNYKGLGKKITLW
ncbi:PorP/SprF family type IX secretion system membrane protein [Adhaeribacter radiodurans]|uniref:PorP/SprF family type IX secretion system membrane protein n=1 Tax=Adhaeribacter radiodurans TaxID=2745197 RepID=A0A7L7L8Y8_9BACT|nr:PorP/SprF family type IX secretion system membrane protein [Adhaeribacter radiodurans]QMU29290.1 PorP/SprF family type IX secretion system membrane protein [Adhaeribacter radiodurans]